MTPAIRILCALLLLGASSARAVCSDEDADLVCSGEDNCRTVPNGPNQLSDQADSDLDGYGNACDADFDGSLTTGVVDFAQLFDGIQCGTDPTCVPPAGFCELDMDGDLTALTQDAPSLLLPRPPPATVGDYALFLVKFARAPGNPGPSGLFCAGTTPCVGYTPVDVGGWIRIGAAGNAADEGGHGSVAYDFRISPREVTNAEYAAFLNGVAKEDTLGLYNPEMAGAAGGIDRAGAPGSYVYSTLLGRADHPVRFVSFYDALRFVNWLHNGQRVVIPIISRGAYTFSTGANVVRNPRARFFLPNEDEWYKAAYYDAVSTRYLEHSTGSDSPPTCSPPAAATQLANCDGIVGDSTPVGAYPGSASPFGTFDQAGNVAEWTESVAGSDRVVRGGDWTSPQDAVGASARALLDPNLESASVGFRVARAVMPCDP